MRLEDFDIKKMEKSLKRIRKMRSEIIEKTINIESMIDRIIIGSFDIKDKFRFRIEFLYDISLRQKIEVLRKIKNREYKELGNKIDKIRLIRNYFAHSPSGMFEDPVIISKLVKPIKAEEEFKKFNRIYDECLFKLSEIIKEHKSV